MIEKELREYQSEFLENIDNHKSGFNKINRKRRQFVKDYSIDNLRRLSMDEYVIGKNNHSTFCYRIENELNEWGNIHGSNAKKFGLYFGTLGEDKTRKYRIGKKSFGTDTREAFDRIIETIIHLIEHKNDISSLKRNLISPMFKGKILSVYFPDEFLNIFAATHLNYFINELGLTNFSGSELDKQNILLDYKNNDPVMKNWTVYEFSKFLYTSFKNPDTSIKNKKLPNELKSFQRKDFPPIEKTKPKFVDLTTEEFAPGSGKQNSGKTDYLERGKRNKKTGDRGEQLVLQAEIKFLKDNNREDLAAMVDPVCRKDDSAGYDILSYDLDENEKYIEVKTTLGKIGKRSVFISSNELEKAESKENYYFYIVYEARSVSPKIWKIKGDTLLNDRNIKKETVLYKIHFKAK